LNFHGLGEPHPLVPAGERPFWWDVRSFARILDQISDLVPEVEAEITITFDDGNASDALLALPELARRGLVATFFICAGRVGKMYYLDAPMIKQLLEGGMSIGSHGMNHRDWRKLDSFELDMEISDARDKLEGITQRPVNTVSVPFGSYDRRILNRLQREPFDIIYTSDGGIARRDAKIKPRATLRGDIPNRDILSELLAPPSFDVRLARLLSYNYKRMR
jgi:peptidoglycan/xylan/chitin deacetylase (PgdA/CDA1 family)